MLLSHPPGHPFGWSNSSFHSPVLHAVLHRIHICTHRPVVAAADSLMTVEAGIRKAMLETWSMKSFPADSCTARTLDSKWRVICSCMPDTRMLESISGLRQYIWTGNGKLLN